MSDGLHTSISAIQNIESVCAKFACVIIDRLATVERELRQVRDALVDHRDDLRRDISRLESEISSADEGDDVSWERSRLNDAEEDLESVKRRIRRLNDAGAAYTARASKVHRLATDEAFRTREFLRGAVDDLKAYFALTLDGISTGTSSASVSALASANEEREFEAAPVSDAIEIAIQDPACAASIEHALAAIDEVHRDGTLPRIPVRDAGHEAFGYFLSISGPQGMTAGHLAVYRLGPWPELTMVHETGHLLDLEGIGAKGSFATQSSDPSMQEVLRAAKASNAIRGLEQMRSAATNPRQREYLGYLLKDQEIWARAYAQFIAERASNPVLKAQIQRALETEEGRQWTKEDFVEIDGGIEKMFNQAGWL